MKTTWRIIKCPHYTGPMFAIYLTGWQPGDIRDGRLCVNIEAEPFTDETFLVVAKWKKLDSMELCS